MRYLLNVDCLEFLVSTTFEIELNNSIYNFSNGLFIKLDFTRNNFHNNLGYSNIFKIFYYDNEIGYLYTNSSYKYTYNNYNFRIELKNSIFYDNDFIFYLKLLFETFKISDYKITRLDICYDTNEDILTKFKQLFNNETISFVNRNKIYHNGTGIHDTTTYIGSIKSQEKSIVIYNKTKELSYSHKEYIRNVHFNVFGPVIIYRIELRLLRKLPEMKNIDIMLLSCTKYLETIFSTYYNKLISFKDIVNNEKIEFIMLSDSGIKIPRIKKKRGSFNIKKIKEVINILFKEYELTSKPSEKKSIKLVIDIFVKENDLEVWFKNKRK